MCGTCDTADALAVVAQARRVADAFAAELLQEPVAKAMDLGTPRGFDRAVASLAAELRRQASRPERDAVREAVRVLDIDWRRTTPEQRRRLVSEAMNAAGRATALIPARIQATLGPAADEVISATRSHGRRAQGLAIGAEFNAVDRRIAAHVTRTQVNFVTDELGRRVEGFGAEARRIVAEGLEAGLGRDDLSAALQAAAQDALAGRSAFYWDVVAGAFVGNGRSYAQLSSYAEAGIARYLIEAVLDERTTEICRYLHGKVFKVGDALRRFDALDRLDAPEDVKQAQPWVREVTDAATGHRVLYVDRGGVRTPIVEVTRSGFGARDDRGDHGRSVSNRELMDLGVSFPPYHGLCRTTTLPAD